MVKRKEKMCASILLFTLGLNGIEKTNSVKVSKSLSEKKQYNSFKWKTKKIR